MEPKDFAGVTNALNAEEAAGTRRRGHERRHLTFLRAQFEAIARNDFEAVFAAAAPDVELDIFAPPEFKWIFSARGVAELRRALAQNFGSLVDQKPEIVNVVAQHDTIVLFGRETGRIRASGEPYDVEFVEKFRFRNDQLASIRIIVAKRTT